MGWEKKANKLMMGKFVRAKAERMVLITFQGEPRETEGKNFKQEVVDELQFPVKFYDERSVGEKYKESEAARIVMEGNGEDKIMPVQGGPLLRCLMDEHNEESIMGRTFILSHVGAAKDTVYKLREVRVPKQSSIKPLQEEEEEEEEYEPVEDKEEQDAIQEEKRKTPVAKPKARKQKISKSEDDNPSIRPKFDADGLEIPDENTSPETAEKIKFKKEVAKRTAARKGKVEKQDPPDEPVEQDPRENQEDEERIHSAENAA